MNNITNFCKFDKLIEIAERNCQPHKGPDELPRY
jgi:hypothetical protein